jgi:hypothetical protein
VAGRRFVSIGCIWALDQGQLAECGTEPRTPSDIGVTSPPMLAGEAFSCLEKRYRASAWASVSGPRERERIGVMVATPGRVAAAFAPCRRPRFRRASKYGDLPRA